MGQQPDILFVGSSKKVFTDRIMGPLAFLGYTFQVESNAHEAYNLIEKGYGRLVIVSLSSDQDREFQLLQRMNRQKNRKFGILSTVQDRKLESSLAQIDFRFLLTFPFITRRLIDEIQRIIQPIPAPPQKTTTPEPQTFAKETFTEIERIAEPHFPQTKSYHTVVSGLLKVEDKNWNEGTSQQVVIDTSSYYVGAKIAMLMHFKNESNLVVINHTQMACDRELGSLAESVLSKEFYQTLVNQHQSTPLHEDFRKFNYISYDQIDGYAIPFYANQNIVCSLVITGCVKSLAAGQLLYEIHDCFKFGENLRKGLNSKYFLIKKYEEYYRDLRR